jgi:N6-L-threonylcarbamoyladenine synthase
MIAFAGALRLAAGQRDDAAVRVAPRWDMASLPAVA